MSKYRVAEEIPVPALMQFAWDCCMAVIGQKIIGIASSPDSAEPLG